MNYCVFDARTGVYAYYKGPDHPPINGDLPTPSLANGIAGIGMPSVDAGRDLPPGAKRVGQGWHAKGIICRPPGGRALSGYSYGDGMSWGAISLGIIMGWGVVWAVKNMGR